MRSCALPHLPLLLGILTVAAPRASQATTIHVPADQPTIQAALNATNGPDTVIVAPGTYAGPGNRDLDFAGKAVRLLSSGGPGVTIIDCGGSPSEQHRAFLFDDHEPGAIVDGFRIINGYTPSDGGAILVDGGNLSGTVVIRNSEFFRNTSEQNGGAIAVRALGSVYFIKCTMAGNQASAGGGFSIQGAFSVQISEVSVTGNLASGGGAAFVDNCTMNGNLTTFSGNHATNVGGGIFCRSNASVQMDHIILWGNCADVAGNELYAQLSGSSTFTCSDIDTFGVITAGTSTVSYGSDVIDQDPVFCGPDSCMAPTEAGWYAVASASPCLAANNLCGQNMGRFGIGCSTLGIPGDEVPGEAPPRLLASPNPARMSTRIVPMGAVPGEGGTLGVYTVVGKLVRTIPVGAGVAEVRWDGRDENGERVAAGLYLLRLQVGESTLTGRVVIRP